MNVFQRFDAGALASKEPPAKRHDCQVRALSSALGVAYEAAWDMLYAMQGQRRACSFALVDDLRDRHPDLHVVRQLDFPAVKGKPRMTPQAFANGHPRGRFVLKMAHHVACMKDGKLLDTWDSSRRCVYTAWEIAPNDQQKSAIQASPRTCSHASPRARLHPCPFQIDVAGNDDPKFCRCCAACENNCLMDI